MREIGGKHEGNLVIEDELVLITGLIAANLTLRTGAKVTLRGMICGDVLVENGELELHGSVHGAVVNRAGTVNVYGSIHGSLSELGGTTWVDSGADVCSSDGVIESNLE